jgi:hypothetical protein
LRWTIPLPPPKAVHIHSTSQSSTHKHRHTQMYQDTQTGTQTHYTHLALQRLAILVMCGPPRTSRAVHTQTGRHLHIHKETGSRPHVRTLPSSAWPSLSCVSSPTSSNALYNHIQADAHRQTPTKTNTQHTPCPQAPGRPCHVWAPLPHQTRCTGQTVPRAHSAALQASAASPAPSPAFATQLHDLKVLCLK